MGYKYVILDPVTSRIYGTSNGGAFPDLEMAERRKERLAYHMPHSVAHRLMVMPIFCTNREGVKEEAA